MPKALRGMKISCFWLRVHLIAFIVSIETDATLLALAKSIIYFDNSHSLVWNNVEYAIGDEIE